MDLMIKEQIQDVSMFNSKCEYYICYSSFSAFRGNPISAYLGNQKTCLPTQLPQFPSNSLSIFLLSQQP